MRCVLWFCSVLMMRVVGMGMGWDEWEDGLLMDDGGCRVI